MEDGTCIVLSSDDEASSKPGCSGAIRNRIIPSVSCTPLKNSMSKTRCLFSEFLEKCEKVDNSDDMKRIILKMWKKYENCDPAYRHSTCFTSLLKNNMRSNSEIYTTIKDVSDELKNNKRMDGSSSGKKHKSGKTSNDNAMDPKTLKHLSKLYKTLFYLSKKIEKLRATEMTLSEDEDSAYILQDRYERRFIKVYNKICEVEKRPNHANRVTLKDISFKETEHKVLNRCIEKYYNKERVVPDFVDIRNIVQTVNNSNKQGVIIKDVHNTASDAFRKLMESIIKLRCYDEHTLVNDYITGANDPADDDEELRKKLDANRGKLQKDVTRVIDDYVEKQTELRLKPSEIDDGGEESEEEEEEEEGEWEEENEVLELDEFSDGDENTEANEEEDYAICENGEEVDNTEVNEEEDCTIRENSDYDNTEVNEEEDKTEANEEEDCTICEDGELDMKQCSVVVRDLNFTIEGVDENSNDKQVPETVEVSCKRRNSVLDGNVSKKAKLDTEEEENEFLVDIDLYDDQPMEDPLQMKNTEVNEIEMTNNEAEKEGNMEEERNDSEEKEQEVEETFMLFEDNLDGSTLLEEDIERNEEKESTVNIEADSIVLVEDDSTIVKENTTAEEVNKIDEDQQSEETILNNNEEKRVEESKSDDEVVVIEEYMNVKKRKPNEPQNEPVKQRDEDVIDVESIPEEKQATDVSSDFDVNRFIRSIGMDLTVNKRNVANGSRIMTQRQQPTILKPVDRFPSRRARVQPITKTNMFPFTSRFPNGNNSKTRDVVNYLNRCNGVTIQPIPSNNNPNRLNTYKPISKLPTYQQSTRGIPEASSSRAGRSINSTISQMHQTQSSYRNNQSAENRCVQTLKQVKTSSNGQVMTSTYTTVVHQSIQKINKPQKKVVPSKNTHRALVPVRKKNKVQSGDIEVITLE